MHFNALGMKNGSDRYQIVTITSLQPCCTFFAVIYVFFNHIFGFPLILGDLFIRGVQGSFILF